MPGVSGNPGGRGKVPEYLKGVLSLSRIEVIKLISKYARMSIDELDTCLAQRTIPVLELTFCSIFKISVEEGDYKRISFLLDQCIGPVTSIPEDPEESKEREELGKLSLKELLSIVHNNIPEGNE